MSASASGPHPASRPSVQAGVGPRVGGPRVLSGLLRVVRVAGAAGGACKRGQGMLSNHGHGQMPLGDTTLDPQHAARGEPECLVSWVAQTGDKGGRGQGAGDRVSAQEHNACKTLQDVMSCMGGASESHPNERSLA